MIRVWLLFVLLAGSLACADTTPDLLSELRRAAETELQASLDAKDRPEQVRVSELRNAVLKLNQAEEEGGALVGLLRNVETLEAYTKSSTVEELSRALAKQLRPEQKKKDAAFIAEMRESFTAALQTAVKAKGAREIDAPLTAVSRILEKSSTEYFEDPKVSLLTSQGRNLSEFLRAWQDCLATREIDHRDSRLVRWQGLLAAGDFSEYVPRSAFLDVLVEFEKSRTVKETRDPSKEGIVGPKSSDEGLADAVKIVNDTPGLKDIGGAIQKLEVLGAGGESNSRAGDIATALRVLGTLERLQAELEAGRATSIHLLDISEDTSSPIQTALSRLRLQLRLYALPSALGLGKDGDVQPEENSVTYLNRIVATARGKKDWAVLGRTADIAQVLNIEIATEGNDRTALQSFLAGMNQERAAQYALAVASFEAALKTGSQIVPPETVGEHLEKIRADHPQDYESGIQNFLNSLTADPRMRNPRYRMPGFPGNLYGQPNAPQPAPTITVPARTPQAPAANAADAAKAK